jgi:iron-sulfur cluster repair protein YtfE (RIC family)
MATFGNLQTDVEPLATLMREHTEIHALVTDARELTEAALGAPADTAAATAALEKLRDLDAYMAEDLVIHITKEEDVLFPALRGFAADIDTVVDEMVEQHDEVQNRQAILERVLAALDHTHEEVQAEHASMSAALAAAGSRPSAGALAGLLDAVKRLDWILQGHFGDEEDDLFVPALELLSPATFATLAEQAAALDR